MLLQRSERRLHLRIDTHQSPGQSYNVVAGKAGTRPERIVLCAHLDTKLETPGAADNGAGVAVLLALAHSLAHRDLYESNHSAFSWRGIPAIAISSVGGANVGHLPTDTVEWISPAKLGEVVALVTDIVVGLQDKSLEWCRG